MFEKEIDTLEFICDSSVVCDFFRPHVSKNIMRGALELLKKQNKVIKDLEQRIDKYAIE